MSKKRIVDFDFKNALLSGEAPNVALVGQAANLTEVLTLKAKEEAVTVTLSMKDFLRKFFNLWEEDAAVLAGILGYDSSAFNDYENENGSFKTTEEFIQEQIESVNILKSFDSIPDKLPLSIVNIIKSLQGSVNLEDLNKSSVIESGDSPSDVIKTQKGESKLELTTEEIELLKSQAAAFQDLQKSVEAKDKKIEDLIKAQKAESDAKLLDLVKSYSFVGDEVQEDLVKALSDSEHGVLLVETLQLAKAALDTALTEELGSSEEDVAKSSDSDLSSAVSAAIKANNS